MESKGLIRTFIGIPVKLPIELKEVRDDLRGLFPEDRIRWVPFSQMHITLRFLGDITSDGIEAVRSRLQEAFMHESAITIRYMGLGTFGHRSQLSVLWTGIVGEEQIVRLREIADHCLDPIFPSVERRAFRPHLTLARMKRLDNRKKFLDVVSNYHNVEFGGCELSRIIFYKSILGNGGPQYEPLEEIVLE